MYPAPDLSLPRQPNHFSSLPGQRQGSSERSGDCEHGVRKGDCRKGCSGCPHGKRRRDCLETSCAGCAHGRLLKDCVEPTCSGCEKHRGVLKKFCTDCAGASAKKSAEPTLTALSKDSADYVVVRLPENNK